jgi:MerR family transcriptional regulator, light-induced transcriptional regulator
VTRLRIGELARRTGVSEPTLRAWERRYGLLRPGRTDGGFRVYGEADVKRVEAMQRHLASGVAAAEAAALALEEPEREAAPIVAGVADDLVDAIVHFDEHAANDALDRALATLTVETAVRDVFFPALRGVAAEWRTDEPAIAREHFATNLIRGRLVALARGWNRGTGPHALLACAPEEQHDVALLVFGLALRERGWRITYLGARTPVATLARAAALLGVDLVVVSATSADRFRGCADALRALARDERVAIGGPGATERHAGEIGAELLAGDPYTAAAALA